MPFPGRAFHINSPAMARDDTKHYREPYGRSLAETDLSAPEASGRGLPQTIKESRLALPP